jgi:hypothetical protein
LTISFTGIDLRCMSEEVVDRLSLGQKMAKVLITYK